MTTMNNENGYNGWTNYETWNVALYIQNDYKLYQIAKKCYSYQDFAFAVKFVAGQKTPDGVYWVSDKINNLEIDELLRSLRS
jgi:hypothetical protein